MNRISLMIVLWLLTMAFAACGTASSETQDSAATAVPPTSPPDDTAVPVTEQPERETAVPPTEMADEDDGMVEETAVSTAPLTDEEATELMNVLAFDPTDEAEAALARVVAADDTRFIAVLIELMRARQIGLVRNLGLDEYIPAIETLSGQFFGSGWYEWVEWYGGTDLVPPPGFTSWKGRVLSRIDVRFAEFLQDSYASTIRVEEIAWGGVVVDGIPALTNPDMLPANEADYMQPWDAVFGIAINGDARAYPLRILDWHEMANDVVGGVPVSLAYCTLCGAAVAYDGRASDGNTYTFGSSGFLFRSNKLMFDRQTRTLWNQLTGKPVLGELVETDVTLDLLPVVLTTWDAWQEQHPETVVVDIATGYDRVYTPGAAYGDYFSAEHTMFPVWQRDDDRATKDWVYTLNIDDTPKAYPVDQLTDVGCGE